MANNISIGTSGYNYKDWKEKFYPNSIPQKKWLEYYSEHFKTVEINATFYGSFKPETIASWYGQTPQDFSFAIKGTRYISHLKRLHNVEESIERFFTQVESLQEKLSVVLWQFPANFTLKNKREEHFERLEHFLTLLPQNIRQAFEFRDESWFSADVFNLLKNYHSGLVINQAQKFPYYEAITTNFAYIRFHGPKELYASKYTKEDMKYWAGKLKTYKKQGDVYAYFNNDFYGYALDNANELEEFLHET